MVLFFIIKNYKKGLLIALYVIIRTSLLVLLELTALESNSDNFRHREFDWVAVHLKFYLKYHLSFE